MEENHLLSQLYRILTYIIRSKFQNAKLNVCECVTSWTFDTLYLEV